MLIETDGVDVEQGFIGHRIEVGAVVADVVKAIDRCVMTTRPQPGGIDRDLDVLRTINAERGTNLGVGTLIVQPGAVTVGDELRVLDRVG